MMDLGTDWHTHSSTSDGVDDLASMVRAGDAAGLHTMGLSDHVRADTTWLPEYVRTVRSLHVGDLQIRCGVEVKIMDTSGTLDLPAVLPALDYLLVADHQFPGAAGPMHPSMVRDMIAAERLSRSQAVEALVGATVAAVRSSPFPAIVAHLFSVLPKCGLGEDDVPDDLVDELARACLAAGAAVEVNEKWRCPSTAVATRLASSGVRLTGGSDAHRAADVGRWSYVHDVTAAL